jgi:hypothetical protein
MLRIQDQFPLLVQRFAVSDSLTWLKLQALPKKDFS